jgi:hypothetical protein
LNTLYFEKISRFDRPQEPASASIPFAQGRLKQLDQLVIRTDAGQALPSQRRALASWPDGSLKWVRVHFQPDLPGNLDRTYQYNVEEAPELPTVAHRVVLDEQPDGIAVNTGPLRFFIPRQGFLPLSRPVLNGKPVFGEAPFSGFELKLSGETLSTAGLPVELEVEETGPLCAVVLVHGKHRRADGSASIELHGRLTAYAGKPYVEIEYQFVHTEPEPPFDQPLQVEEIRLDFHPHAQGPVNRALGEGYYQTRIQQAGPEDGPLSMTIDGETLLYQANEHYLDSFYGDFWTDWRDERAGLALSFHQAHQNYPKALSATPEGIQAWLYPPEAQPAPFFQGMGKTHRLLLHFHAPDFPLKEISTRSLQFQLPDLPRLSRDWYRENNPWVEDYFPARIPARMISLFNRLLNTRPPAMGMFHFGDAPDAGYSNQGRGHGQTVWVNNEYDRPHACTLFYAFSGQRRVLDSAVVAARHWLDVDYCHYSPDPLTHHGLKIHTAYHVTGGAHPSHEWTEGFLDYYFMTGRREGLEVAREVGENILRHMALPALSQPGEAAVREGGWALRAMVGLYLGTGEERWKNEARKLVEMFLDWRERFGALLAPYTSHTMPRVTFMISLTANSFARYLLLEDDPRVKKLIVETVEDLVAHHLGPDGIGYYKELPSLQFSNPTMHFVEALAHAYRISGDERYLKVAARQFAAFDESLKSNLVAPKRIDESGAVIYGEGGGRTFDDKYTSLVVFAAAATPAGYLDWYEYPY